MKQDENRNATEADSSLETPQIGAFPLDALRRSPLFRNPALRAALTPILSIAAILLGAFYVMFLPVAGGLLLAWAAGAKLIDLIRHPGRPAPIRSR